MKFAMALLFDTSIVRFGELPPHIRIQKPTLKTSGQSCGEAGRRIGDVGGNKWCYFKNISKKTNPVETHHEFITNQSLC